MLVFFSQCILKTFCHLLHALLCWPYIFPVLLSSLMALNKEQWSLVHSFERAFHSPHSIKSSKSHLFTWLHLFRVLVCVPFTWRIVSNNLPHTHTASSVNPSVSCLLLWTDDAFDLLFRRFTSFTSLHIYELLGIRQHGCFCICGFIFTTTYVFHYYVCSPVSVALVVCLELCDVASKCHKESIWPIKTPAQSLATFLL